MKEAEQILPKTLKKKKRAEQTKWLFPIIFIDFYTKYLIHWSSYEIKKYVSYMIILVN